MNTVKKINFLFLFSVILSVAGSVFVSLLATKSLKIGIITNIIVSQGFILVPGLLFVLLNNGKENGIKFGKLKITTVLMMIIYTELCMPLATAANVFSQLFTKNEVVGMSGEILDMPFWLMALTIGVFGPVCEEFVFRGIIFQGLRSATGRIIASVVLSAVFFGLMHLNLNQFCYALVLGLIFAITDEALGGLWPSIIMHTIINVQNVAMLYLSKWALKLAGQSDIKSAYDATLSNNIILFMSGFFFVMAVITVALAILLLMGMCQNEGRMEYLKNIFRKNDAREKVLTVSGIIGITICLFVIFALGPVTNLISKYL